MCGDRYFFDTRDFLIQSVDQLPVFLGHAVTNCIGNVNGRGPGGDHRLDDLAEKCDVGAGGIFGRELNVGAKRLRVPNRVPRLLQALLAGNAQLVFQMNVGGGQKDMDAWARGPLQCLPGAVHVARTSPCQAGDDGTPHRGGNALHGFEVAVGSDRESGLDHIHAEAVELLGQSQLFLYIHAAARRLLAVTKRGVEDGDARPIHRFQSLRKIQSVYTLSANWHGRKGYYSNSSISSCYTISKTYVI